MTGTPQPGTWEAEGQRLAPLLDDVYATVVAGADSGIAASVAIGIARAQGARRRVAIADLVGESLALEALLTGDDPHGISDSFLYGVSLNKIARPVGESGQVFIMPSGTESVATEAVYANDRWRRLAAGFHQVGALLLVVAVPGTPGFAELCGYVGAVMPVGGVAIPMPPGVRVIAPPAAPVPTPPATVTPRRGSSARARAIAAENSAQRNRRLLVALLLFMALGVLVGTYREQILPLLPAPVAALFPASAPDSTAAAPVDTTPAPDSVAQLATDSLLADSLRADSLASAAIAAETPPLEVANPADSLRASRFAIYYATANTPGAAMPDLRTIRLHAVAMSPVPDGGEQWYRVTVGATASRAEADSMLRAMRAARTIGAGSVLSVPYALRLEDAVEAAAVSARLAEYEGRGIVAYALRQANGRAVIMTGAFETPTQAAALADSLQKAGIAPVLIYRTGRAF